MRLLQLLPALALGASAAAALEFSGARCSEDPATRVDCYPAAARFPNATEELCLAHGCCWKPLDNGGMPCAFDVVRAPATASCARVPRASRLPCRNPRFASEELSLDACHLAGCCFDDGEEEEAGAACFQPFFEGYELVTLDETADGWRGDLVLRRFERGPFANDLPVLLLHVVRASPRRVRVRISDPAFPRFEVPDADVPEVESRHNDEAKDLLDVMFTRIPFGVAVARRDTGKVLFNSTPPLEHATSTNGLVFENQFIEFSTQLHGAWPSDPDGGGDNDERVLYGLGDRLAPLRLPADSSGRKYPLFSRTGDESNDESSEKPPAHAGSVHPMYLQVAPSGLAHGVFVRSANAMEAIVQRDAVTFRLTGGIVDLDVFAGPTPSDVIAAYTGVVGRPQIPPYWALGFHVGSGRDQTAGAAVETVARLRVAGMPVDAYWLDGESTENKAPLTLDEQRFSTAHLHELVDDMHFNGQYLVCMQVPTVVSDQDTGAQTVERQSVRVLDAFQRGEDLDVFVKGVFGERFAEKFVAGHWSVFVDFFHPNASEYWRGQLLRFRDELVPFDGLWLERNEPSSSCDRVLAGEEDVCAEEVMQREGEGWTRRPALDGVLLRSEEVGSEPGVLATVPPAVAGIGFIRSADVSYPFDPFRQPFVPGETTDVGSPGTLHGNLNARTLPLAANHFNSMHYNVHSMYGLAQTRVTREVLDEMVQRRALLISRSTFPGSGRFAGHSLQDFDATWEHLPLAIGSALRMSMFGIPLAGPNLGGLRGEPTAELYVRWFQATSLLPLLRSHTRADAKFPTPIDVDESTTNVLRSTLLQRYRYLPYMYTLFYQALALGSPVVQPVGFAFPADVFAHRVETQFLLGPALMVTPVVKEKAIAADVYFPNATWFAVDDGRLLFAPGTGHPQCARLLTPLSKLQLHIRGGHIVPTQQPQTTTALSRHGDYVLLAALGDSETGSEGELASAAGEIYIDDGATLDPVKNERYSLVQFRVVQNASDTLELTSKVAFGGYDGPEMRAELGAVKVYGVRSGFHGNSSIRATMVKTSDASSLPLKVDYFAQSNTLVLSRLRVPISDEFTVQVRAVNGLVGGHRHGDDEEGEGDDQDVEGDQGSVASASRARSSDGAEAEGEGQGQEASSKTKDSSKTQGEPKRRNYSTTAIIGGSVAAVLLVGVCIVYFVRRRGYSPIP